MFTRATKIQARLRLALCGPSGSGKTYTALNLAQHLGSTIALIDTEHRSASKYADRFSFDTCSLTNFHPGSYIEAIRAAGQAKYDTLVIDSLTHAWFSELELAGGRFDGWKNVRPLERALIDAMLASPCHIIATMRTKTEWVMEEYTNKSGKTSVAPKKVGTAPIQSSGIEYEFDVSGELNLDHLLNISKSRCPELSNTTHLHPGKDLADVLKGWLEDGDTLPESVQSKCERVKIAREGAGLSTDEVRQILEQQFHRSSPGQLSTEECDHLIEIMGQF